MSGSFREVIDDTTGIELTRVERVLMCSGQVYYDVLAAREERKIQDVAIVRLEQIYPFPAGQVRDILARYPADGRSGLGAGRAAQYGRVALRAGANAADPRAQPARASLRRPRGQRQPVGRFAEAPSGRAGGIWWKRLLGRDQERRRQTSRRAAEALSHTFRLLALQHRCQAMDNFV